MTEGSTHQVSRQLHDQGIEGPAKEELGKNVRQDCLVGQDCKPGYFEPSFASFALPLLMLTLALHVRMGKCALLPDVLHFGDGNVPVILHEWREEEGRGGKREREEHNH